MNRPPRAIEFSVNHFKIMKIFEGTLQHFVPGKILFPAPTLFAALSAFRGEIGSPRCGFLARRGIMPGETKAKFLRVKFLWEINWGGIGGQNAAGRKKLPGITSNNPLNY
jgi:hypothetical protein